MNKRPITRNTTASKDQVSMVTVNKDMHQMAKSLAMNAAKTRAELLGSMIDGGGKDLDMSCGYPNTLGVTDYQRMYAREGVAARVVDVWPDESWSNPPVIYETEDPKNTTEFETMMAMLNKKHHLLSLMHRADKLSGVGRFGVLLIGLNDGKPLSSPVKGVGKDGTTRIGKDTKVTHEITYLRPFAEPVVAIGELNKDVSSPRFGLPLNYKIIFQSETSSISTKVHWHRVVHFADRREMSDTLGTPRMQKSYNRLLDLRKVLGGSAEMFWKGGFPGYSFEVNGDDSEVEVDKDSLREEMQKYMLGLQRYIALEGVTAKSLQPQVADPEHHIEGQLSSIAITEGIPKRVLFGSEAAELASSQDSRTWLRRVKHRQNFYVTPYVVRNVLDRLIAVGVLPVVEEYFVTWPDINTQTDVEKAEIAKGWAEALSKFVQGSVDMMIPPEEFFAIFGGLSQGQIQQIKEALNSYVSEMDDEEEETPEPEEAPKAKAKEKKDEKAN